jgi:hypothetical protein
MSDMTMHAHDGAKGAGDAKGAAALAMFVWGRGDRGARLRPRQHGHQGRGPLQRVGPTHRRAARSARTMRTSWSLCTAGTTCAEGERSAPLP